MFFISKSPYSLLTVLMTISVVALLLFTPDVTYADPVDPDSAASQGAIAVVFKTFTDAGKQLEGKFRDAASYIFYCLMSISMVWTFGQLAIKRGDLGEFVSELVKFIMYFGFFLLLFRYSVSIVNFIEKYVLGLAGTDSKMSSPAAIIAQGFDTCANIMNGLYAADFSSAPDVSGGNESWGGKAVGFVVGAVGAVGDFIGGAWDTIKMIPTNLVLMLVAIGVLIVHVILAIDLFVMNISLIMLSYIGMFLLGFGGSRWTSDIAINYYKTVLGQVVQMLVLLLICSFCAGVMDLLISDIRSKGVNAGIAEAMQVLVGALVIYFLGKKLPCLISGIISSASGGSSSVGGGGALLAGAAGTMATGTAMGAAKMAGMQSVVGKNGGTNSNVLHAIKNSPQHAKSLVKNIKNRNKGNIEPGNKKEDGGEGKSAFPS